MQSWHDESIERAAMNDEVRRVLSARKPYIPEGCDQQGRQPEAAHAASEITDDDALGTARGVLTAIVLALGLWAAVAAFWVALS